jgi:hypothetical protein
MLAYKRNKLKRWFDKYPTIQLALKIAYAWFGTWRGKCSMCLAVGLYQSERNKAKAK